MNSFNNINNQSDEELTSFDGEDSLGGEEDYMNEDDPFGQEEIARLERNAQEESPQIEEQNNTTDEEVTQDPEEESADPEPSVDVSKESSEKKTQLEQAFDVDGPFKPTMMQRIARSKKLLIAVSGIGVLAIVAAVASLTLKNGESTGQNQFSDDAWGSESFDSGLDDDWDWGTPSADYEVAEIETVETRYEETPEDTEVVARLRRQVNDSEAHASQLETELERQRREIHQMRQELLNVTVDSEQITSLKAELDTAKSTLTAQSERIEDLERQLSQRLSAAEQREEQAEQVVAEPAQNANEASTSASPGTLTRITGDDLSVISAVEGFGYYKRLSDGHEFPLEEGEGLRGWGTVTRITTSGCIHIGSKKIRPSDGECN